MSTPKQAYQEKYEAQLREIETQIAEWRAKTDQASAEARLEYQKRLDELENKRTEVRDRLQQLRYAGEDAWHDVREGVDQAWNELQSAFKKASERFQKLN